MEIPEGVYSGLPWLSVIRFNFHGIYRVAATQIFTHWVAKLNMFVVGWAGLEPATVGLAGSPL